jgi:hypothetical protein
MRALLVLPFLLVTAADAQPPCRDLEDCSGKYDRHERYDRVGRTRPKRRPMLDLQSVTMSAAKQKKDAWKAVDADRYTGWCPSDPKDMLTIAFPKEATLDDVTVSLVRPTLKPDAESVAMLTVKLAWQGGSKELEVDYDATFDLSELDGAAIPGLTISIVNASETVCINHVQLRRGGAVVPLVIDAPVEGLEAAGRDALAALRACDKKELAAIGRFPMTYLPLGDNGAPRGEVMTFASAADLVAQCKGDLAQVMYDTGELDLDETIKNSLYTARPLAQRTVMLSLSQTHLTMVHVPKKGWKLAGIVHSDY